MWPNGKAYFFKGGSYLQYDIASEAVDFGFPKRISEGWPGVFTEDIDAVAVWPDDSPFKGKAYFFKGDQYTRFDVESSRADPGYPVQIASGNWPGLFDRDIDAVCVWPRGTQFAGKVFFFRGDEYLRYDVAADRADPGYPAKITDGNWPGLFPEGSIDAACAWPEGTPYAGKIYFFSGEDYIQYCSTTDRTDPGYPQRIEGSWSELSALIWARKVHAQVR